MTVRRLRAVNRVGGVIGRFGPNGESGVWPVHALASDPYYQSVELLLHFDGTSGSSTFADLSKNNHTVTVNGTCTITDAYGKFGQSFGNVAATTDYLSVPASNLGFGTGDFTFEAWYLRTANTFTNSIGVTLWQPQTHSSGSNRINLYIQSDNRIVCAVFGTELAASTALTWTANQWYHIACTRSGGAFIRLFRDGVLVGSNSNRTNNFPSDTTYRVQLNNPNHYIDDLRVTKGVSRYTSAFNPPTRAFLP